MRIATWNVNGIRSRLAHVLKWCSSVEPDVLCLQETKCVDRDFPSARLRSVGFEHFAINGERAYNGVAILSKRPLTKVELELPGAPDDLSRRFVATSLGALRIVNVYVPHGSAVGSDKFAFKLEWIARLRRYFDRNLSRDAAVLLCGDLNVAPHEMDVWNPRLWQHRTHFSKPERDALHTLRKWGFVDVFRQFNGEPGEYSWWDNYRVSSFAKNRGLRIDHIWTTPGVASLAVDCWIDKEPRGWEKASDHAPVIVDLDV